MDATPKTYVRGLRILQLQHQHHTKLMACRAFPKWSCWDLVGFVWGFAGFYRNLVTRGSEYTSATSTSSIGSINSFNCPCRPLAIPTANPPDNASLILHVCFLYLATVRRMSLVILISVISRYSLALPASDIMGARHLFHLLRHIVARTLLGCTPVTPALLCNHM